MIELTAGDARVVVDPACGGRLRSLMVDGLELLGEERRAGKEGEESADPMTWGCFPMAPWAGRVRRGRFTFEGVEHQLPINMPPHAIHGTVFDRPWPTSLKIGLGPDWPFEGSVEQRIDLQPDHLRLELLVHAADGPMPTSCGWHPWFRRRLARGGTADLDLDAASMWQRDADGIPSGDLVPPPPGPWDDCFTGLRRPPRITWPSALTLTIESSCQHVVVYDEPADAICVEPQTHPPDALNLGPAVVEPGRPLVADAVFRWS